MFDIGFISIGLIALQVFCIYHAYKNGKEPLWYFLIIFLPMIGSLVYLITQVFQKRTIEKAQDTVSGILNPTKKINDLKKALAFAKTHENQVALADAYMEINDFENAIALYNDALHGLFKEDTYVLKQLLIARYKNKDFSEAVTIGKRIETQTDFIKSNGFIYYAMALANSNKKDAAKAIFEMIDKPFSNYKERLIYAKYLIEIQEVDHAKTILKELCNEAIHASKPAKNEFKSTFNSAKKELENLQNQ